MSVNGGRIAPATGSINDATPDVAVVFVATPPANSGLRVLSWSIVTLSGSSSMDGLAPYSESISISWNNNHYFSSNDSYVRARFYYITNSVSYHAGAAGATGSMAPSGLQCYTNSYPLASNGFSLRGYTFLNWTNEAGVAYADAQVVSGSLLGVTDNLQVVDLYAEWSPNAFTLSYDISNGVHGTSHPSSATYDVAFEVSDPTRTGYTFTGWKVVGGLDTSTAKYVEAGMSWSSISYASRVCKGENGSTWFKNLNPTNGAAVALAAQWTPKATSVHFNNYDASSGAADRSLTYGEPLQSVQIPTWSNGSKTFLGYYTGEGGTGECYWDRNGQPKKSSWDVEAQSITLYAHTLARVYYVTYRANGGTGADVSMPFTNGTEVALSDGAGFSRQGSELLGWARLSTVGTPEYGLGEKVVFDNEAANFDLFAIWQDFYYVAFDGNGATNETPMAVQKFAFGSTQELRANEYGKVGYTFAGWATNAVAAAVGDIAYADREPVSNLARLAGETNTLFAAWSPISYVTAFDASEHSAVVIAPSNCVYDVAFPLPVIPYGEGELWKHVGWSNTVANVVYYTNEVTTVSNLCTEEGATNTLVAVWASMVGELSEAMDIYNLRWRNAVEELDARWWRVVGGEGCGTPSCAAQTGIPITTGSTSQRRRWQMTTVVTNSGTLAFWYKTAQGNASLYYFSAQDGEDPEDNPKETFPGTSEWTKSSIRIELLKEAGYGLSRTITLRPAYESGATDADTIYIDRMTWTPDGSSVEPGAGDAREISQMSFSGGVLSLVFTNADERFSYDLHGTNELVTPLSLWPVLWTTNGTGTITIEPPVAPGETKMFYYLETRKKE